MEEKVCFFKFYFDYLNYIDIYNNTLVGQVVTSINQSIKKSRSHSKNSLGVVID